MKQGTSSPERHGRRGEPTHDRKRSVPQSGHEKQPELGEPKRWRVLQPKRQHSSEATDSGSRSSRDPAPHSSGATDGGSISSRDLAPRGPLQVGTAVAAEGPLTHHEGPPEQTDPPRSRSPAHDAQRAESTIWRRVKDKHKEMEALPPQVKRAFGKDWVEQSKKIL